MYTKSPDWPRVFWKSYEDDGVDPGSSLANLINDNLSGRFRTDIFEKHILDSGFSGVSLEDLRSLIQNASFVGNDNLPDNEIRSGDLFIPSEGKYLINIRPDCELHTKIKRENCGRRGTLLPAGEETVGREAAGKLPEWTFSREGMGKHIIQSL